MKIFEVRGVNTADVPCSKICMDDIVHVIGNSIKVKLTRKTLVYLKYFSPLNFQIGWYLYPNMNQCSTNDHIQTMAKDFETNLQNKTLPKK